MMLPAFTCWLPNFLTPSLLPSESRPFLELPPAFLVAIIASVILGACQLNEIKPSELNIYYAVIDNILISVFSWR